MIYSDYHIRRFLRYVPSDKGGCLEWMGDRDLEGYGRIMIRYVQYKAHRLSWEIANAQYIPEGLLVCHKCDNPPCVKSDHLFLGTLSHNMFDSILKGKRLGEANPNARLSLNDVEEIRFLLEQGTPASHLAETYKVAPSTIGRIKSGQIWRFQ